MMGRSIIQQRRARKYGSGRKGTIWRDSCYVYFIRADIQPTPMVKIGHTTVDVHKRLNALQLGSPVELVMLGWVEALRQLEVDLHLKFKHLHSHREWFRLEADLIEEISSLLSAGEP